MGSQTKRRSLLISFFIATGMIIVGITLSLSGFFYASYENDLLKVVQKSDRETLLQLNSYLSELLDYSRATGVGLLLDPNVMSMVNNPPRDAYILNKQLEAIRIKLSVFPYIHSAVLTDSLHQNWFFTLTRTKYERDDFIDPELRDRIELRKDRSGLLPRTLNIQGNGIFVNENLLTLVIFESPVFRGTFVAINITAQELASRMTQVSRSSYADNDIFLVDHSGTISAHSNRNKFGFSMGNSPLFTAILENNDDEGTFIISDRGNRLVVSYFKRTDGYLIRTSSYAQIFASLVQMRKKIIGIGLLALFIFLSTTFTLQWRLLRPLRSLTNKIGRIVAARGGNFFPGNEVAVLDNAFTITLEHLESLKQFKNINKERLQSQFMEDMVNNRLPLEYPFDEQTLESLGLLELAAPAGGLFMVAIRVSVSAELPQVREKLKNGGFRIFWNGAGSIFSLAEYSILPDEAQIEVVLGPLVAQGYECAVGTRFPSFEHLQEPYSILQRLTNQWFFHPNQPGIFWQSRQKPETISGFSYPVDLEIKTQENLRLRRLQETRNSTNQFLEQLPKENYESAILGITRFSTAVFEAIGSIKELDILPVDQQFSAFLRQLHQTRYLSDVGMCFSNLYKLIEAILLTSTGSRTMEIAERIRELMDQDYQNPNLSVKYLAELVRMTPAYTGQVFRQVFGLSISQYLLDLRLKRARELIATTNDSIKDIARKVGIENYKYFYTRYKSHFGISPGRQSREIRP